MFDAVVILYRSENINWKMILHNKLRSVEMTRSDIVTNYLMKVTQIHDQLALDGEKVEDKELVNQALYGFPYKQGGDSDHALTGKKKRAKTTKVR